MQNQICGLREKNHNHRNIGVSHLHFRDNFLTKCYIWVTPILVQYSFSNVNLWHLVQIVIIFTDCLSHLFNFFFWYLLCYFHSLSSPNSVNLPFLYFTRAKIREKSEKLFVLILFCYTHRKVAWCVCVCTVQLFSICI